MSTATIIPFATASREKTGASERYQQLYRVAEETVGFGKTVRLGGVVVAGVLVVAASVAYQVVRAAHAGFPSTALWLIACAIVAVLVSHIWERLFVIQGHLLRASVDLALNSSPFLSNTQRAEVMSLRD